VYYTSTLLVPVTLPKYKTFPPTFNSCLIARAYSLDLSLSIPSGGAISSSTLTLKVPLQITAASNFGSAIEQQQDGSDVVEFFAPRSIAPPAHTPDSRGLVEGQPTRSVGSQLPPHMMVNAALAPPPPGYTFFPGITRELPVRIPSPLGISPGCG
jgi:hypothetical protein